MFFPHKSHACSLIMAMARDLTMEPSVGVLASMIRGEFEHLDRMSS